MKQEYFYQYNGSLTTPAGACAEGVKWNVYAKALPVRDALMKDLIAMYPGWDAFAQKRGNNRRTQPLNDRRIYFNTAAGGSFSNATFMTASMSVFAAAAASLVI